MSDIQFWLTFNNGAEKLRLPVNPESIKITSLHSFNDIQVSKLGEYTVIGDPGLKIFEFSSHFPKRYSPVYCEYEGFPDPWEIVAILERWRASGWPCRLIVTNTPINHAVTIRSIEYDAERAGRPGDIYYDITLKEFKFIQFKRIAVSDTAAQAQPAEKPRPNPNPVPTSYTVKKGDSLSVIAQRLKAKGVNITWQQLYEKNKSTIGKNPNLIYPGQKLTV